MAVKYEYHTTDEGDSVDLIAHRRFGDSSATAAILAANPGLAALGPTLPAGLKLAIPVPEQKDRQQSARLWS